MTVVPHLRSRHFAALRGAGLLMVAGVAFWSSDAPAQIVVNPDPLVPWLQTDPRHPPRFQRPTRLTPAQAGQPTSFTAPAAAAGAGETGFDSTNSRKKTKGKAKAKSPSHAQAIAPGLPAPAPASPYQRSVAATAGGSFAQAPGTPPVELGPIRRQPKKRKAHSEPEDPYAPVGVRAGAFTLFPAIEFIGGHDSNPARVPGGGSALLYTVAPELQVQSNWSRHELKADLRGSYTGYDPDTTPTLSRPNFNGKVDGRIDVTHDTRIDLNGRLLVATDNPGSPNLQAGIAKLPVYTTFGGSAGLGQQFNRLDLSVKGDVERTVYQNSQLTDGTTASNEDRDYNQYGGTLRAAYELSPGVKPYVEIEEDNRVHDLATDFFGYQRDSKGFAGLAGSTFKLTNLLTGDFGIGYGSRSYQDPRLQRISGLIGNASLIWTASALTTVKLTGASQIAETVVPGVSGELSRDVGLQIDHSFRRWLIGTVKVGFGVDDYVGMDREDKRYSAGLGLTYKLSRSFQIKGEFQQNWLHSNVAGTDYTSSVFLLGLRLQR
ncbi:MAG: outer membrane beta-barrel protein [Pseudolabrys sp.]